jgi:hypothetical protein
MAGPIVSICTSSRAILGLYKHFSFGQGQTDVSERGMVFGGVKGPSCRYLTDQKSPGRHLL